MCGPSRQTSLVHHIVMSHLKACKFYAYFEAEFHFMTITASCFLQLQEWKLKCEAIERRESERREAESKKHKEEVAYLETYAKQLKSQLETYLVGRCADTNAFWM
jgi:hypothetical protein